MTNKVKEIFVNVWATTMVSVITLGLVGVLIAVIQWILKLLGVL